LEEHEKVRGRVAAEELHKAANPALYLGSSKAQVERAIAWLEEN
jgi:3-carboxy-cis,cis-muconate cycloisomerase